MKKSLFKYIFFITTMFNICCVYAQIPNYLWAINGIGKGDDRGFKITSDTYGNVIVTGRFQSKELLLGNIKLTNSDSTNNSSDIFIAKYNSNAEVIWAKSIGGLGDDFGSDCVTDSNNNIILIAEYDAEELTIDNYRFRNKTNKGEGSDLLVIKYSSDGKVIWAKSIGGEKHDGGYATCAIDAKENVYVTGNFYSKELIIDDKKLVNSKTRGADMFLVRLSAKGKVVWAKTSSSPDKFDCETQSCSIDNKGNIIVSGMFGGPYIIFDNDTLKKNSENSNRIFVSKYSTLGNLIWAKNYNGTTATTKVDSKGNIFIAGMFADSIITYGKTTLDNKGGADIFIAKLDSKGQFIWAKSAGGKSVDGIRNFCLDKNGNPIITGSFSSPYLTIGKITISKDTINLTTKNEERTEDILIAAYSKDGDELWAKSAGGKGRNAGRSCVCDKNDNVYCVGSFDVTNLNLGTKTLKNSGDSDFFIFKLAKNR